MRVLVLACALVAAVTAVACTTARSQAASEVCTVTAPTIPFGNVNVFVAPGTITATVGGNCKKGSGTPPNIVITLDNGLHVQASGNRAMSCTTCTGAFLSDVLQYQIYTDAALTTIWAGATSVSIPSPCPCGNGAGIAWGPINMYAQVFTAVPGGVNDSAVGSYSDTVTVTVNY